jgi:hypothetical protein
LILVIAGIRVDKLTERAVDDVNTMPKDNEASSVNETKLLPILKLNGKQESEIFEAPRKPTEPVGIERQVPVCIDCKF